MLVQQSRPTSNLWSSMPYEVDDGIGHRAHIGMVVISNDQTLSYEARAMLAIPGVALYESRIPSTRGRNEDVTFGGLTGLFDSIDGALKLINEMRPSDVIALGCTSAALVIGPNELERRVRIVHPQAKVTDPFTGILAALRSLGSARVGFVSPYPRDVAEKMVRGMETVGLKVPTLVRFDNDSGFVADEAPFISPVSISNAVRHAIRSADVDTVVVACTQMRAAAIIGDLEKQTGKAIISSNQALCWHALRLAGCRDVVDGWGRLFEREL